MGDVAGPIMSLMVKPGLKPEGVSLWSQGKMGVSFWDKVGQWDVALVADMGKNPDRPVSATYMVALEPWAGRFVGQDGGVRTVRSFRCRTVGGEPRYLLYCAACGCVRVLSGEDFEVIGTTECEKCGAVRTEEQCRRWHNWGGCGCCPSVREQSKLVEKPGRGPATVIARPEDRPPTKAGPSATSLGSCRLEVSLEGHGVRSLDDSTANDGEHEFDTAAGSG